MKIKCVFGGGEAKGGSNNETNYSTSVAGLRSMKNYIKYIYSYISISCNCNIPIILKDLIGPKQFSKIN